MSQGGPDATCTSKAGELFDEVTFITKRLEHLEDLSEQRDKAIHGDHASCRREIARLQLELQDEKDGRQTLIGKKNAEVAYFKAELDALLSEI